MATSDILGLFMSPEQYQAQQMAQQQAGEQQRAFNFAGLDPRQQANYGVFLGAQQLGRGIGGLLGVQDPQLQRIRQRQEIMQSINPADPQSLMAGIQRAAQTNDQELALTLTDFMNKQGSEMALAQQRKAQAARERTQALPAGVQEAELIGKLTEELQKTTDPNQRAIIQAKIQRLQKTLRPIAENKVEELQQLFDDRETAVAQFGADSNAVRSIDRIINVLAPLKGGAGGEGDGEGDGAGKSKNKEIAISRERARLTAKLRSLDAQNLAGSPEYLEAQDELNFLNQAVVAKPSDVEFKLDQARPLIAKRNDLLFQGYSPESREIRDIEDELEILGAKRETIKPKQVDKLIIDEAVEGLIDQQQGLDKNTPEYSRLQDRIDYLRGASGAKQVSAFGRELIESGVVEGSTEYKAKMALKVDKDLRIPDKEISFGTDREAIAREMYGKRFSDLTQVQQAAVNKRKEDEEQKKKPVTQIQNVMPGQGKDGLTGIGKFRNEVGESIKPFRNTVNASDAALQNIDDAIRTDNFASFNAARTQLAKALGDSTLSRLDVERAGGDPSFTGKFFDAASTLFSGTPSIDTQKKIKVTLQSIRKVARKKAQDELEVQRQLGIRAGYSKEDIDLAFKFPEITGAGGVTPKPVDGGGGAKPKTVPFNTLPK